MGSVAVTHDVGTGKSGAMRLVGSIRHSVGNMRHRKGSGEFEAL